MKKSNAYWEKRSRERMTSYHRAGHAVINIITTAYEKAKQDIIDDMERIYSKFALDSGWSKSEAINLLHASIDRNEWFQLKSKIKQVQNPSIRRQLLNRINLSAYRARLTRLQMLQEQLYVQCKWLADVEIQASRSGYIRTIHEAYYRTLYDIQRGLGVGFEFVSIPNKTIQTILKRPWSGSHFSARIWGNTDILAAQVTKVITAAFMSGAGTSKIVAELSKRMDVGKFAATRLARTEMTYMANAAEIEAYQEADIDKYQFIATLDRRTSEQCRRQDLQIYNVSEAVAGKNLPPLHTFCRSTTRAYLDKQTLAQIERRARDPETGKSYNIPAQMTYKQWETTFCKH